MAESLLEIVGLTVKFGGLTAVNSLDLVVGRGEIVGLIGPNGAGKTTTFNVVTGVFRPTAGKVIFDGEDITGFAPHVVCRRGIARTFQVVKPFGAMTVLQNVMVGAFARTNSKRECTRLAEEVLEKVGLTEKRDVVAKNLTIVDRRRLELARALATEPKLLLLDEVLAGLNPTEVEEAVELVRSIHRTGTTIVMIEHVLQATMALCPRIVVLDYGRKIAEGTPEEVTSNPEVIKAYLGDSYGTA